MLLEEERNYIVDFGKKLVTAKLTTGTGGDLSMINRSKKQVAISSSGLNYFKTRPMDVVITDMDGRVEEGSCKPSSELKFHLDRISRQPFTRILFMPPPLPASGGTSRPYTT